MFRRPLLLLLGAVLALSPAVAVAATGVPPVNTTPAPPAGWLAGDYSVQLGATDADGDLDRMQWRVDGAAEQDAAAGDTVTVSGEGLHTLETRALDLGGNDSGWRADTVRIDQTAPADITDGGATGWRTTPAAIMVAAADAVSDVDHVEWTIDGGAVQSGANGSVVSISGDGTHTLSTRAVDLAGNTSTWRDHTVRIDTVAPSDTTSPPAGWQDAPLGVTVTGSDAHSGVSQVEWRLDGGATSAVSPGTVVTVTGDGEHVLETRVRDAAGNWSGWKAHIVRIDTTAPDNQTPAAPAAWRAADYSVTVSGADGGSGLAHVEWRVNSGAATQGTSGILQAHVTGTGVHTLETRAVDTAGNASAWRAETVRIDTVKPANTTSAPPTGPVANPHTVTLGGTDAHAGVAYLEWTLDGGAVQLGDSGDEVDVTGHGTHTLRTRVVDAAGNASDWREDSIEIDVALNGDTTAPTDTTTTAPAGWEAAPVDITIAATDAAAGVQRVQWRLDGRPIETFEGAAKTITIDGEGVHVLETRAYDRVGNRSAWRVQTIRVDLTVPADTTAIGPGWQSAQAFTLAAEDAHSGVAQIEYRIDGGPLLTAAAGTEIDVPADGTYVVEHRAIDVAGHASAWVIDTLRVDGVDPENTTALPSSAWSDAPLELALAGDDALSGLAATQWRVDGGDVHDGGPAVVGADGEHLLETRAVDLAGNTTDWRADTVRVDVTDPENLTPGASSAWRSSAYTVQVAGADGAGSGVEALQHTIDGGPVSEDPDVTVAGDGVHTLRTRVVDGVGRTSGWRRETIRIDSVRPAVAVRCGGTAGWNARAVSCTVSAGGGPSGLASLTLARDGGAARAIAPGTVVVDGDGAHRLTVTAADGAGNRAGAQAVVHVDRSAPAVQLTCDGGACRIAASDAVSGVASIAYSVDGGEWQAPEGDGTFSVTAGEVRARAVDAAGNAAATAPVTVEQERSGERKRRRARSASLPVYLRGRRETDAMIGALRARRTRSGRIAVDLRPLALGKGRYRIKLRVKAGKRRRTVKRNVRVRRGGGSPRLRARLRRAPRRATVTLRVHRRRHGRWQRLASARLKV